MRNIIRVLIIGLWFSTGQLIYGQSTRYFERKYYTNPFQFEEARTIQVLADGYIIGNTYLNTAGNSDIQFRKVDLFGNPVWIQTINDTTSNVAILSSVLENTNIVFTGYDQDLSTGITRTLLMKSNYLGSIIWSKSLGDSLHDNFARCMSATSDGGFILGGHIVDSVSNNYWEHYFIKTDSSGNVEWTKQYHRPNHNEIWSVNQLSDSTYYATGYTELALGQGKIWLVILDSIGNIIWDTTYFNPNYFSTGATDVVCTKDNGFVIVGATGSGGTRGIILKVDSIGNEIWSELLTEFANGSGNSFPSEVFQVKELQDSTLVITGYLQLTTGIPSPQVRSRVLLLKLDKDGNEIWRRLYPINTMSYNYGMDLQITPDDGFIISGISDSLNNTDVYLIKTNCLGFIGPPQASFTSNASGTILIFTNTSQNADTCIYFFGDGDSLLITNSDTLPISHTYTSTGWYQVYMIAYACGESDTVQIPLYVGISDEFDFGEFEIYPNPTSDWFMITYQFNGNLQNGKLVIRDIVGRSIDNISIENQSGSIKRETSSLPAGFYSVTFQSNGNSSESKRLMILR